jgi:hypothetical protein
LQLGKTSPPRQIRLRRERRVTIIGSGRASISGVRWLTRARRDRFSGARSCTVCDELPWRLPHSV